MNQNQKPQLFANRTLADILKKEKETPHSSSQFQSKISISNKSICSIGKGIPSKYLGVTHLLLHNNHLSSLSGIESFQNLTHLSIASNDIESLSELSKIYNKSLITSLNVKKNFFFKNPQANIHLINLFPNMKYLDGFKISDATYKVIKESENVAFQIMNFVLFLKNKIISLEKLYSMIKINDEYTRKKINGMNCIDDIDNMIYKINMLIKLNKVMILKKDYIEKYLNKNINPSVHVLKKIIEKSGLYNQDDSIIQVKHEDYSSCYEELFSNVISLYEEKNNYNELPCYLNYLILKDNPFLGKFFLNSIKQQSYEDKQNPIQSPIELISYICKGLPTLFMHYTNHSRKILLKYQMMYFYQLNKENDHLNGYHPANEDMMIYFDNNETEKINLDMFNNKVCHFLTQFECDSFPVFALNFDYMRILTSIIQERILEYKGKTDKLLFFNQLLEERKKMFQQKKVKNVNKGDNEIELFMFHFAQNDMRNLNEDDQTKVVRGNKFNKGDQHEKGLGHQLYVAHNQDINNDSNNNNKSQSHSHSFSHSQSYSHTHSFSRSHSNSQTKSQNNNHSNHSNSPHSNNNNTNNINNKIKKDPRNNQINTFVKEDSLNISQDLSNNRYMNNDNNTNQRSNSEECNSNLNIYMSKQDDHLENIPFTIKSNEQFTLANNDDNDQNHPNPNSTTNQNSTKNNKQQIRPTTHPNKKNIQKNQCSSYSPNLKTSNDIIHQVKKDNRSNTLIKRYLKYNNGFITLDMISRLNLMKVFFNKLSLHSIQLKLPYLSCAIDHLRQVKAKRKLLETLFIYNNKVNYVNHKHHKTIKKKLVKLLKNHRVLSIHLRKGHHYFLKSKGFFTLYNHMKQKSIKKQRYNRIQYYYYNKMVKKFWLMIKFNHHIQKETSLSIHYNYNKNEDFDEINRYPQGKFKNLTYTPNNPNINTINDDNHIKSNEQNDEEYSKVYNFFHRDDSIDNQNEQPVSSYSNQFNKKSLLFNTDKNISNMIIDEEEEYEESVQKEDSNNIKSMNEVDNLIDHLEARLSSISKSSKQNNSKYDNEKCSLDLSNSNTNSNCNNNNNKSNSNQSKSFKKTKGSKLQNELCPYCISSIKHTQCASQNGTPFITITNTSSSKGKKDILTPSNAKILLLGAPNYIRNTPTFIHKKLK